MHDRFWSLNRLRMGVAKTRSLQLSKSRSEKVNSAQFDCQLHNKPAQPTRDA